MAGWMGGWMNVWKDDGGVDGQTDRWESKKAGGEMDQLWSPVLQMNKSLTISPKSANITISVGKAGNNFL